MTQSFNVFHRILRQLNSTTSGQGEVRKLTFQVKSTKQMLESEVF